MGFWDAVESAGHMQTICTFLQTDNHTNTSSVNFYRSDALRDPITNSVRATVIDKKV